jgi:hypothetical protein
MRTSHTWCWPVRTVPSGCAELDAMISNTSQTVMNTTVTPLAVAKMIRSKRADYLLIDEEENNFLNQRGEVDATIK